MYHVESGERRRQRKANLLEHQTQRSRPARPCPQREISARQPMELSTVGNIEEQRVLSFTVDHRQVPNKFHEKRVDTCSARLKRSKIDRYPHQAIPSARGGSILSSAAMVFSVAPCCERTNDSARSPADRADSGSSSQPARSCSMSVAFDTCIAPPLAIRAFVTSLNVET